MQDIPTIHERICSRGEEALLWPPDIFGFTCYFAKVTGVYTTYARNPSWVAGVGKLAAAEGDKWRDLLDQDSLSVPPKIRSAWKVVCNGQSRSLDDLVADKKFVRSLLFLLAAADQACAGIGVPTREDSSWFELVSELHLAIHNTLCKWLPFEMIRVLPKMHTPHLGLNVRSLSLYLALCGSSEVRANWTQSPLVRNLTTEAAFGVLLAPWPLDIEACSFSVASLSKQNPEHFGYVDYSPVGKAYPGGVGAWTKKLLRTCDRLGQRINLVVFPECALSQTEWRLVSKICASNNTAVVAGVRSRNKGGSKAINEVKFYLPLVGEDLVQGKHHRWQIDDGQIKTYSLGGSLDTKIRWWENIEIGERLLHFVSVHEDLTICALICEDLARQDPVSEIVRSVGPNLVIALLMDGPQLNSRWSSRYASVLADDPGCSVITLSSLGMVRRSRPNGCAESRVIASWKDAFGSLVPIDLESGKEAVILNLQFKIGKEWTVDGRHDGDSATFPILCGTHAISSEA